MSKVALSGNALGSGTLTIAAPNTSTDRTLNLPDASGTILTTATPGVPVNGPAFSAYANGGQSVNSGSFTKVQLNNESFDTNNNFDPTTNYRFQPTTAGYYQINGTISFVGASSNYGASAIYKNGSIYAQGSASPHNTTFGACSSISAVVLLNGSTDYVELYCGQFSGSAVSLQTGLNTNTLSGALIRSAT